MYLALGQHYASKLKPLIDHSLKTYNPFSKLKEKKIIEQHLFNATHLGLSK